MSDKEQLLRAILANPEDETVRLIYADLLEELGETDRAAFIRLQIAPQPEQGYRDKLSPFDYLNKQAQLMGPGGQMVPCVNSEAWCESLWMAPGASWSWNKGFVFHVHCTLQVLEGRARRLFSEHPVVGVNLSDVIYYRRAARVTEYEDDGWTHETDYWTFSVRRQRLASGHFLVKAPMPMFVPSEAAMRQFVSDRCVAYGRKLVGVEAS